MILKSIHNRISNLIIKRKNPGITNRLQQLKQFCGIRHRIDPVSPDHSDFGRINSIPGQCVQKSLLSQRLCAVSFRPTDIKKFSMACHIHALCRKRSPLIVVHPDNICFNTGDGSVYKDSGI